PPPPSASPFTYSTALPISALLTLQKGLPLAYNRDLQEDKVHVFALDDTLAGTLGALGAMLESAEFHPPAPSSFTTALDLAEALVERGVPFREAHQVVGRLVARLVADGRQLSDATATDLEAVDQRLRPEDLELTDPSVSVRRRRSPGGGGPDSVRIQVRAIRRAIESADPAG